MHITAVRRSAWGKPVDAAAEAALDAKGLWGQMSSLTGQADIIILATSQDATTRGFVNQAFLSACKPGVIIVNVARGKHCFLHPQCWLIDHEGSNLVTFVGTMAMPLRLYSSEKVLQYHSSVPQIFCRWLVGL